MAPEPADVVVCTDVLEHVEADREALTGIARKLKPGGRILITVPAHPWLWSAHDVVNHHKRRYTRRTLKAVIAAATHPVLSGPAVDRLKATGFEEVIVTNTLPIASHQRFDSLTELSIAPLLARAIREVFEDGSVTKLFDGKA